MESLSVLSGIVCSISRQASRPNLALQNPLWRFIVPSPVAYFPISLAISTSPSFIHSYETALWKAAPALRSSVGQVRLLYYAGLPPPDITLACLFPCSVRRLAPHLFISEATVHPYWLSFKPAWTIAVPVVAEAAHFGLLLVERRCPFTPQEMKQLREITLQMSCHLWTQLLEIENRAEASAPFIINKRGQWVLFRQELMRLRGRQLTLFQLLYKHRGYPCSRRFLCGSLYGSDAVAYQNALTLLVHHLRRKLERHPENPLCLENVRHRGYCLRVLTKF